jgi:uncharacterized repeat protein (TIGR02543 family)
LYSAPSKFVTPIAPASTTTATITFNANGGSGTMASETEPYDTTATLTLNTFTYTGYTFTDWNTDANGSGSSFTNGELVKFTGSTTLYAQWTVGSPTSAVVFNANGGSGTMSSETESVATALTLNTFTRTGYTFNDWNTAASGSGTSYANGATYGFTTSITLYAQWTETQTSIPFTGSTSSNWSGYILPSSTDVFTQASGEWVVPTLNCADTPDGQSATWVGTGGVTWPTGGSSGELFQAGVIDNCVNGIQENDAVFELFPYMSAGSEVFVGLTIESGDEILSKVGINTDGQWIAVVENLTTGAQGVYGVGTGWDISTIASNTLIVPLQQYGGGWSYAGAYSAEWIEESQSPTMANFGSITFTDLATSDPSWYLTSGDREEITNSNGAPVSVPGTVSNDGFTVTYTG